MIVRMASMLPPDDSGPGETAEASKRIVLVGAGHAHVEVLRSFGERPQKGISLTLISNSVAAVYSGMLPGFIAGHCTVDEIRIPVEPLTRFAGCELVMGEATEIDPNRRSVLLKDGREIFGDIVSLDVGALTKVGGAPTRPGRLLAVKPIERFAREWETFRADLETASSARIAVIGAGAAGIELALALQHRLGGGKAPMNSNLNDGVTLVVGHRGLVPNFPAGVRRRFARLLSERGITTIPDADFAANRTDQTHTRPYDVIINAAGVVPALWLTASGLALDQDGFVAVDACLRSVSHRGVFAAGDAAGMVSSPRPKAGVFGVRQGPALAENLRRCAAGEPLIRFLPQASWLSLISAGDRYAIASRGAWSAEGYWVWLWKRWIDRRFIRRYTNLPAARSSIVPEPGVSSA